MKKIKDDLDELLGQKQLLIEDLNGNRYQYITIKEISEYIKNFNQLLAYDSLNDQKKFVNLFIKKIILKNHEMQIEYTLPMEIKKAEPMVRVLPTGMSGSPYWKALELLKRI